MKEFNVRKIQEKDLQQVINLRVKLQVYDG